MAPKRLYEVAHELGLRNRQLAEELEGMGYPLRSFASPMTDEELREIYLNHNREWPGESRNSSANS